MERSGSGVVKPYYPNDRSSHHTGGSSPTAEVANFQLAHSKHITIHIPQKEIISYYRTRFSFPLPTHSCYIVRSSLIKMDSRNHSLIFPLITSSLTCKAPSSGFSGYKPVLHSKYTDQGCA
jgi:hypothetical protein